LDTYLPKLVRAGEKVAVCDQLEDPKMTKTIVKRGVTELVTPGVSYNDKVEKVVKRIYTNMQCSQK
jgi:DNA mismatch repair protein MutS